MSPNEVALMWIVEDDEAFAKSLCKEFRERGFRTRWLTDRQTCRAWLSCEQPDYAIIDLRLLGQSGLSVLEALFESAPKCRAVILTGYGSIPTAVEAIKFGAVNYLTKPVTIDLLEAVLLGEQSSLPAATYAPGNVDSITEPPQAIRETLARHEREYIEYVLAQCDGNISKAAKWLGIHRQSLQRKLRKFPPRQ